eukprot:gb/GEZN01010656.1/.p1 GENE.gb/GEZN01010656.1/~~gb/GEZN01010656.1/.p1  ORF type:complete len:381 (+),score=37.45 gb/GEZN01010656.1/:24-1166(+)
MLTSVVTRSCRLAGARSWNRGFHITPPALRIYDNILDTIGNTPIVGLPNLSPPGVNVYAKLEYFNPLGSVKDRMAYGLIENALETGQLKEGQTVVEATSGNTGIALAMVCAQKRIPLVVVMVETFSIERRKAMRMMGAKVVLTPAASRGSGMIKKAQELAEKHGWYLAQQFESPANPAYHARTTACEILNDFRAPLQLDYFVTGYGTGGTLQGVAKMLKVASPKTKIIVCEPPGAALLTSGKPQSREANGMAKDTHPAWSPHPIQGWTPDFIPLILQEAQDMGLIDEVILTDGIEAIKTSHLLAQKEGIFTGVSGGATVLGALQIATRYVGNTDRKRNILAICPDSADRYMTTPLFEPFAADMNQEEIQISKSTPGFQLK